MKITLKQLALFVAVAKNGSVTQAANELFLSQSAASMTLAELEGHLGKLLFDRIGKKLILNQQGKNLYPKALEVLARTQEIEQESLAKETGFSGSIHIGASSTIGNYLLPRIISQFITKHPKVSIKLAVANSNIIINELLKFNIDLGFIEGTCHHPEILIDAWKKDELMVFAAAKHPLAKKKKLVMADLATANWVLRESGSGTRTIFENAIYAKITNINILLELGSSEAVKQAVATGVGISCLSQLTLQEELAKKKLVALPTNLNLKRTLYALIHKNKYQTRLIEEFRLFSEGKIYALD